MPPCRYSAVAPSPLLLVWLLLASLLAAACAPAEGGGDEGGGDDAGGGEADQSADAGPDGPEPDAGLADDAGHGGHGDAVDHDAHGDAHLDLADPGHDAHEDPVLEPDVTQTLDVADDLPLTNDSGPRPDATDGGSPALVPEFGDGTPELVVIGDASDALAVPRDLAFHPDRPNELWTVNRADDSTVIFFDPGTATQTSEYRKDVMANHFMEEVSSIAFGAADTFGTCQESRNTYDHHGAPNDFMGPALWPADLDVYAVVNQSPSSPLLGSHIDMLHQSPLCMGIAHDHDNVYWVFDGMNGHVVYYDFVEDHGPGYDDHADGIVRRYPEVPLNRVAGVPGHLVLDPETGWLYVADPGSGRVLRLDTGSGEVVEALDLTNEYLAEFSEMGGATVEVFAFGLDTPSGIALGEGRLFVGDYGTGEIVAYDLAGEELGRLDTGAEGLMGLEVGPDGRLWYVDAAAHELVRVTP